MIREEIDEKRESEREDRTEGERAFVHEILDFIITILIIIKKKKIAAK